MFSGCTSLQAVPLFDTALCTNFQSMFSLAATLATVAPMDVSAAAAGGMSNMFASCFALRQGVLTGCARTISYTGCALSAAELDRIYTALASGVTAQAITVTTNFGNTADTPSIATAKGWTVTG
jgi:hypothetical protein